MTENDKRATTRVPVALRIRLRYQAVDQFISKFAVNISRGGMFLSSRNPKPPGTELYFEILLADESPLIEGTGEVRWIREYDRRRPNDPHGMGIQFKRLGDESRAVLDRVIEHRRSLGENDDGAIPEPRGTSLGLGPVVGPGSSETDIRPDELEHEVGGWSPSDSLTPVPTPIPTPIAAPTPVVVSVAQTGVSAKPRADSSEPPPAMASRPEPSERHGPDPDERPRSDLARAPTPPAPRPAPPDVVRSAPVRSAIARGTDPPVVRTALARARTLAGTVSGDGDLDRELAELLDANAAPVEITVDAASRELAERLGGAPVARRSPSSPGLPIAPSRPRSPSAMSLDVALGEEIDVGVDERRPSSHIDATGADGPPTERVLDHVLRGKS